MLQYYLIENPLAKNLKYKHGWLNRIAAMKFMPLIMLFVLFGMLTGCSTAKKHTAPVETCVTEKSVTDKEMIKDNQQAEAIQYNDSTIVKTGATETKQTQLQSKQPVSVLKSLLTVLVIVLLALWLYYVFRLKK